MIFEKVLMQNSLCFFDYNINFGGAPKGSISLCASLAREGFKVVVYDVYGGNKRYFGFICANNLSCRILFPDAKNQYIGGSGFAGRALKLFLWLPHFIKVVFRARSSFKADAVNLVWVNNSKSLVTVSLATLGLGVKKVLYHRGWAKSDDVDLLFRLFIRFQCDALIGHSLATVQNLKAMFPLNKVYYVPNSVAAPSRPFRAPSSDSKNGRVVLLPAARPVYEKGHHTAVLALSELVNRGIENISLRFPGEIPVGVSDQYLLDLKALIARLRLEEKVEFVGWLDSLDEAIQDASVVILPSHTEGFPRVIIESMLLGTPVIATPVGGIPEAVVDGDTGLIVDIDNAHQLADAIERLISNPDMAEGISRRAYALAAEVFSPERQLECIKEVFFEVLENG